MAALAIHHSAVVVRQFDSEVIINLAVLFADTVCPTSRALNRNGIFSFYPVCYINIMNVLFDNVIAAQPVKIIPISHLILHLGLFRLAGADPNAAAVPIHLTRDDIAYRPIPYPFDGLAVVGLVTARYTDVD